MGTSLGVVADDVTGATDIAAVFRRRGLRCAIRFGPPAPDAVLPECDVAIVALKTRTMEPDAAVRESLDALRWLRARGVVRFYFKYCSTFDSTPRGNIGPVLDAFADELGVAFVPTTPSTPHHGRRQFLGHLFVNGQLLHESPMRHHPLTPMLDSSVVRLLQAQTPRVVGLVDYDAVRGGGIAGALAASAASGVRYAVIDAVDDDDLRAIGAEVADLTLVAGAAGLATGIADAVEAGPSASDVEGPRPGRLAVLSGSCSRRTLQQLDAVREAGYRMHQLRPLVQPSVEELVRGALAWADDLADGEPAIVFSSVEPDELRRIQDALGVDGAAELLETATASIARGLVARGTRTIVTAGGETAGAVVRALGVSGGTVGAEEAPGVPWIHADAGEGVDLLLKSGNFGDRELIVRVLARHTGRRMPSRPQ